MKYDQKTDFQEETMRHLHFLEGRDFQPSVRSQTLMVYYTSKVCSSYHSVTCHSQIKS